MECRSKLMRGGDPEVKDLLRDIRSFEIRLSKEEETELHRQMVGGDRDAREKLIFSCVPFAFGRALKYYQGSKKFRNGVALRLGDLVQEAMLGLILAVDRFDPEKSRLVTFSDWHIQRELCSFLQDNRMIRIPRHLLSGKKKAKKDPIPSEYEGIDGGKNDIAEKGQKADYGLDDFSSSLLSMIFSGLHTLNGNQRAVIFGRILEGRTHKDIGGELGISRQRAQQIEVVATNRLIKEMTRAELERYRDAG